MGKYWTEKQNNVDDILAEDFNSAFDNIAQDITNALTEVAALSDKIDTVKSETEQELSGKADKTYVDEALANIDLSEYATKTEVEDEATARTNKDTELEGKITSLTPKYGKIDFGLYMLENNSHYDCVITEYEGVYRFDIGLGSISDVNGPFESSIYLAPCSAETIIFNDSTGITSYFGDDCNENGVFTPQANTHYEISFKRVGTDSDNNPIIIARVGAWQ